MGYFKAYAYDLEEENTKLRQENEELRKKMIKILKVLSNFREEKECV